MTKILILFVLGWTVINSFAQKPDTVISKKWVKDCRQNVVFLLKTNDLKDSLLNVRLQTIRSFEQSNDLLKTVIVEEKKQNATLVQSLRLEQESHKKTLALATKSKRQRKWFAIAGFGAGLIIPFVVKPP